MIIYNPFSGKQKKNDKKISAFMKKHKIPFEFYMTKAILDGYHYVREKMEIDKYSALIAVGGDGTIHEVINGML